MLIPGIGKQGGDLNRQSVMAAIRTDSLPSSMRAEALSMHHPEKICRARERKRKRMVVEMEIL